MDLRIDKEFAEKIPPLTKEEFDQLEANILADGTVEDLQNILMCGRATVYDLLKKNEFRYFKLGGSGYRISRKSFDEWLDKQS